MFPRSISQLSRSLAHIRPLQPASVTVNQILISNRFTPIRRYSAEPSMDEYEAKIYGILKDKFSPKELEVKDVSGGCGSMFAIRVESEAFKGLTMVKQHRLVNELLADEISKWHGLQLRTKAA